MRRALRLAALQRRCCSNGKKEPPNLFEAIDEDMTREEKKQSWLAGKNADRDWRGDTKTVAALEGDGFKQWRDRQAAEAAQVTDLSVLQGKATVKGTELFFSQKGIDLDKPWVRTLPSSGLKISALTHAVKRMSSRSDMHKNAVRAAVSAGINSFELYSYDSAGLQCFAESMLAIAAEQGVARSNYVVTLRVGWVVYSDWMAIHHVAPDLSAIPTSRDLSTFGPDITAPITPPPTHISFTKRHETRVSPQDPDAQGDFLLRKFRDFMPDQPKLDIKKMSDGSLLKLSGLICVNKKLGQYWSGDPTLVKNQIDSFRQIGLNYVDYLLVDSIHVALVVAPGKEDFIRYVTDLFVACEQLVAEKKIGWYGVESKKLHGGSDTKFFVDLRWILEAARAAGGENHHMRMVSMPFNLTETGPLLDKMADDRKKSVLDFVKEESLGCMTTRPLSTYDTEGREQRYVDHSKYADKTFPMQLAKAWQRCFDLEEANDRLMHNVVMRPAPELYHFGRSLSAANGYLNNYYLFDDYVATRYDEMFTVCMDVLREGKDAVITRWTNEYRNAYEDLKQCFRKFLMNAHAVHGESVRAAIDGCLGDDHKLGAEMSQVAVNSVLASNAQHTVCVGMRNALYVDALVSRNYYMLRKLPTSVLGRLFTEPEVSFLERRVNRKRVQIVPPSLSENQQRELAKKRYEETGVAAEVVFAESDDDIPSWVKIRE